MIYTILSIQLALISLWANGVSTADPFKVIAFSEKENDEDHVAFVKESNTWFAGKASANGYTYNSTNDWMQMTDANLKMYQLVLLLDGSPVEKAQRDALQKYVEGGGGLLAFHESIFDDEKNIVWPWLLDTLLGTGKFVMFSSPPQKLKLHIEAPMHPAMKGLPNPFTTCESEWHQFEKDPRKNADVEVLASIDNSTFPIGTEANHVFKSGYYPIILSNKKYKVIYVNWGDNTVDAKTHKVLSSSFDSNDENTFLMQSFHYLTGK